MSSTSSKTDNGSDPPETIAVARVLGPHGVRGEVAVEVLTDAPRRLDAGSSLLLVREGQAPVPVVIATKRGPDARGAAAASAGRARRRTVLLRLSGCDGREQAEALRGAWLEIERSRVPPAPAGTYYRFDLVGCRCLDGGEDLGEVVDVVEDGGGLLLVVSDGSREVPVPFVARFLVAVDLEGRRIDLELPPGLIEVCASRS
jgi:16S rRNA processing protein RimM